jgi:hypothetical protein
MAKTEEKKLRREAAQKKAKRIKTVLVIISALVLVAVLVLVIHTIIRASNTETFSGNGQIVQLFSDGKYFATLAHNVRRSGTYTKYEDNGGFTVEFVTNGFIEVGWIINNELHMPEAWDDFHNHGRILPPR